MSVTDWLAVVAQVGPTVLALARVWELRERVRTLEAARPAQGGRIGSVEQRTDQLQGRFDELSRTVHSGNASR